MAVILLVLGIVVAAAGVAAIGFGVPINEFTLGNTLILTGATALTGGLILIALSAVVSELGRLAEGLRARPAARSAARAADPEAVAQQGLAAAAPASVMPMAAPPQGAYPPVAASAPPPRSRPEAPSRDLRPHEPYPSAAPSSVEVSAAAIERLRSSIPRSERSAARAQASDADLEEVSLAHNGGAPQHAPSPRAAPPRVASDDQPESRAAAEEPAGAAAVEALKASRLDFLFRSKPARPAPESFEAFWPPDGRPGRLPSVAPEKQSGADQVERQADPLPERRAEPPAAAEPRTAAVLKSGVVDGMAYTLYADGSIEAKLPHGTVRFGSITELRAHIESNS
jgi:hypothetical protein